jgi:hypothetical protein
MIRAPALVAQACNPSYSGGRDWEDHNLTGTMAHLSSQLHREAQIGRPQSSMVQAYKARPCLKNNQYKRGGNMAQVEKSLPSKHEAECNPLYNHRKSFRYKTSLHTLGSKCYSIW